MEQRSIIGGALRTSLTLALIGGASIATVVYANAQVNRTSPREHPGYQAHKMGAASARSPLAMEDARPIDSDRDGADRPAGSPERTNRQRRTQDCVESSRNDPRWKQKKSLAEPHCSER